MDKPPLAKRVKRFCRYGAIRIALFFVSRLPLAAARRLGRWVGRVAFALSGTERRRTLESLAIGFPGLSDDERKDLAQRSFEHLGQSAFELACISKIDRQIDHWVEWPEDDRRVLDGALEKGRGVVFVSGHVGNWELLARRVALAGYPCHTIAKATSDARTTRLVERFRQKANLESIWRGEPGAAKRMLRVLKNGEILGLVIDQDTRVQSVFVPFFGRLASTPRAAADLVLRTGAAVVAGFCQRGPDGRHRLSMNEVAIPRTGDDEADAVELTARITARIEAAIRTAPEQWVWMHRRWRTRP